MACRGSGVRVPSAPPDNPPESKDSGGFFLCRKAAPAAFACRENVTEATSRRFASWRFLDYADVVIHVQHEEDRVFYALERLWKDCPVVDLQLGDDASAKAPAAAEQE